MQPATYMSVRHQGHLAAEVGVVTGCCCSILQGLIICLLDAQQKRPAPTAARGHIHLLSAVDEQHVASQCMWPVHQPSNLGKEGALQGLRTASGPGSVCCAHTCR